VQLAARSDALEAKLAAVELAVVGLVGEVSASSGLVSLARSGATRRPEAKAKRKEQAAEEGKEEEEKEQEHGW